jgi:hypothetical protein
VLQHASHNAVSTATVQTVSVGPWTIGTSFKAEKFDSCTMSRSANDLDITFARSHDGLLLLLDSSKWKLERGKAYDVTLVAGARAVQAKALAEVKSVTIALPDRPLGERVRTANILEVRGEGATLKVPLDGSTAALNALNLVLIKIATPESRVTRSSPPVGSLKQHSTRILGRTPRSPLGHERRLRCRPSTRSTAMSRHWQCATAFHKRATRGPRFGAQPTSDCAGTG